MDDGEPEPLDYASAEPPRKRRDPFHIPRIVTYLIVFGPVILALIASLVVWIIRNV
ncbi:MAG: hypothetical protein JXQ75_20820 [Phycisphaerae bacterium]|nr:hypothetical protein [Phycisphaerae bacterium]